MKTETIFLNVAALRGAGGTAPLPAARFDGMSAVLNLVVQGRHLEGVSPKWDGARTAESACSSSLQKANDLIGEDRADSAVRAPIRFGPRALSTRPARARRKIAVRVSGCALIFLHHEATARIEEAVLPDHATVDE